MGQYTRGRANVTQGEVIVIGDDTLWFNSVKVGDEFKVKNANFSKTVQTVVSDTELTLSHPWTEPTVAGVEYQIVRDFTAKYNLREIHAGDKNWPFFLTQNLRTIDSLFDLMADGVDSQLVLGAITYINGLEGSADTATEKASAASASAGAAKTSETNSANSAALAGTKASESSGSANAASTSEHNAAISAAAAEATILGFSNVPTRHCILSEGLGLSADHTDVIVHDTVKYTGTGGTQAATTDLFDFTHGGMGLTKNNDKDSNWLLKATPMSFGRQLATNQAEIADFINAGITGVGTGGMIVDAGVKVERKLNVAVKSVIFDIKDNWGNTNYLAVRSIEFIKNGTVIPMSPDMYTVLATSQYDVVAYLPVHVFDTSRSKTGLWRDTTWLSAVNVYTNQRLVIIFNDPTDFDDIRITNGHSNAEVAGVEAGIKHTKITTSKDTITDVVYDSVIANSEVIFEGVITKHVVADVIDEKDYLKPFYERVKSVVFDFSNNWGGRYMGVRSIEFFKNGARLDIPTSAFTAYATSTEPGYQVTPAFDTTLPKIGSWVGNSWVSQIGNIISQRLVITFSDPIDFDEVIIDNAVHLGGSTSSGIKDTKISISTDVITDATYNAVISNSRCIFDGEIKRHTALDQEDDQPYAEALGKKAVTARSVTFDFRDNHDHATYIGVRSIEFLDEQGVVLSMPGFTAYGTGQLSATYSVAQPFTAGMSKTNTREFTAWLSNIGVARLTVVFPTDITFYSIRINNGHHMGGETDAGVKNTRISTSTFALDATQGAAYGDMRNTEPYWSGVVPQHVAEDRINEFLIVPQNQKENFNPEYRNIKSVVVDIANNWGHDTYLSIRGIEFIKEGVAIPVGSGDFTTYATSMLSTMYAPKYAFIALQSKTGNWSNISWIARGIVKNQRIAIVFNSPVDFDEIVINNSHKSGAITDAGIKLTKIQASKDTVTDTTYNAPVPNSHLVFSGIVKEHVAADVMDDQVLGLPCGPKAVVAQIVCFDFTDNWGRAYMGIRSIEFLDSMGNAIPFASSDFTSYATSTHSDNRYQHRNSFNTSMTKLGTWLDNAWLSDGITNTKQRLSVVFNTPQIFYGVRINNAHSGGTNTNAGAKNTKIWLGVPAQALSSEKLSTFDDTADLDLYWGGEIPKHVALDQVDEYTIVPHKEHVYHNSDTNTLGSKNTLFQWNTTNIWAPTYKGVRSVILDIASNHGDAYVGIRSIEFLRKGTVVPLSPTQYSAYATTQYSSQGPVGVFDTAQAKAGGYRVGNTWLSGSVNTNQRVVVVFNSPMDFDEIVYNGHHSASNETTRGIKDVVITASTSEVTSTVYNEAIPNATEIFNGELRQHVPYDSPDDQHLGAIMGYESVTTRSVCFDIADSWGRPQYMAIRNIQFLDKEGVVQRITGFVAYTSTTYDDRYLVENIFDVDNPKTGVGEYRAWLSSKYTITNQRITIVFDKAEQFYGVRLNNNNSSGSNTDAGIRNTKIYTTMDDLSVTIAKTYGDIVGMNLYWSGEVPQHVAADRADDFTIQLPNKWEFNPATGYGMCVYEGNGASRLLPHPMSKTPSMLWAKGMDVINDWAVYSAILGATKKIALNTNGLVFTSGVWQSKEPTNTGIYLGGATQINTAGSENFMCGWFGDDLSHISQGMTGYEESTAFISSADLTKMEYGGVKSVILDIADNWVEQYMGITSIEFRVGGVTIPLLTSEFTAYSTSRFDANRDATNAFDTTQSKTGSWATTAWLSVNGSNTNQRLIIVFSSPQVFDEVVINNIHSLGAGITAGIKNTVITTSPDEITDVTYNAPISNGRVIFDGVIKQHPATDTVDDQSYCLYENSFDCGFEPETVIYKRANSIGDWSILCTASNWNTRLKLNDNSKKIIDSTININGHLVNFTGPDEYLICAFSKQGNLPKGKSIQIKADSTKPFVATIDQGFDHRYGAKDKMVGFDADTVFPMSDVKDGDHTVYINADGTLRYGYGDLPIADVTVTDGIIVDMDVMPEGDEYETEWFPVVKRTSYILPNRFKSSKVEFNIYWNSVPDDEDMHLVTAQYYERYSEGQGMGAHKKINSRELTVLTGNNWTYHDFAFGGGVYSGKGHYKLVVKRGKR